METASAEKDVVKELKQMAERLKGVDKTPDEEIGQDEADSILGKFLDSEKKILGPYTLHVLFVQLKIFS